MTTAPTPDRPVRYGLDPEEATRALMRRRGEGETEGEPLIMGWKPPGKAALRPVAIIEPCDDERVVGRCAVSTEGTGH